MERRSERPYRLLAWSVGFLSGAIMTTGGVIADAIGNQSSGFEGIGGFVMVACAIFLMIEILESRKHDRDA